MTENNNNVDFLSLLEEASQQVSIVEDENGKSAADATQPPQGLFKNLFQSLSNAMFVKVKYHNTPYKLQINPQGGCVDLYNANDISLKAGEFGFIKFGVSIELPENYDALILPRSSTFKKYGILLTNSVGYIDNSYNGDDDEWMACVYATRDIEIPAGTRCFQFRLIECQSRMNFMEVDSLGNENRGSFGSSGD